MRKFRAWLNKPITWKSVFITSIASLFLWIIEMAWMFGWFKVIAEKIKSIKK